ncbi:hypothetical protein [Nonomuraea bangladeshensis]|uniref:hypothetical protein n=1 Tax=Nonomuraea bangladeshensis TaxID=404385 RepID=UPI003C2E57E3
MGEFLSWCCLQGWVPPTLVNALTQPKYLRFLPAGFDAGEDGQNRTVMARTIKFRVANVGFLGESDDGEGAGGALRGAGQDAVHGGADALAFVEGGAHVVVSCRVIRAIEGDYDDDTSITRSRNHR